MNEAILMLLARFGYCMLFYIVFDIVNNVLIRIIYCKWKKKHDTGYRCYFWTCKHFATCPYNHPKSRLKFVQRQIDRRNERNCSSKY